MKPASMDESWHRQKGQRGTVKQVAQGSTKSCVGQKLPTRHYLSHISTATQEADLQSILASSAGVHVGARGARNGCPHEDKTRLDKLDQISFS